MNRYEGEVYSFIKKFISDKKYPPVYSEIAKGVGISMPYARHCVVELKRRGMVKMEHRKARTIVVCDPKCYARPHK